MHPRLKQAFLHTSLHESLLAHLLNTTLLTRHINSHPLPFPVHSTISASTAVHCSASRYAFDELQLARIHGLEAWLSQLDTINESKTGH